MVNYLRRATIALTVGAAAVGALAGTAATADAAGTDQYDRVRYVMCASGVVDIEYTNSYGNSAKESSVYFKKNRNGLRCGTYDFTEYEEYGGYVSVSVVDDDGGPVSCAIWVNGRVVSKSNDDSSYFSYASCY